MENPLILPARKYAPTGMIGREKRKIDRQMADDLIRRKALQILGKSLPEILTTAPDAKNFDSKWAQVNIDLKEQLKSEHEYRFAYSFLSTQIEKGNRIGLWNVTAPTPIITLRRQFPLRTLSWQHSSQKIALIEKNWRQKLQSTTEDADTLLAKVLVCGLFYGGLNRHNLWLALAHTLSQVCPLEGSKDLIWLTLRLEPDDDVPSNYYETSHGTGERNATALINYFPDPVSLGAISHFLEHRPEGWMPPLDIKAIQSLIAQELSSQEKSRALCRGGIATAECLPGIQLPQFLVEYAIGRQSSSSLPLPYWHRLLSSGLYNCTQTQYSAFKSISSSKQRPTASTNKSAQRKRSFLLEKLLQILKPDRNRPKKKIAVIEQLQELCSPELTQSEQVLLEWLTFQLVDRGNQVSTTKVYADTVAADWLSATLDEPLDTYSGEDFFDLYQSILNRPRSLKARMYEADRLEAMHHFAVERFDFCPLPQSLTEDSKGTVHISACVVDEPLFEALCNRVQYFEDLGPYEKDQLQIFLVMAFRTGLRPGELAKLRLVDIEPSPTNWIFVRNNRHGHNKTEAALRKVPLAPMLPTREAGLVTDFIGRRRLAAKNKNELFFHEPENPYKPLDTKHIAQMVRVVLGELSGGLYYRLYHLRHSALSRLQLLLHHDLIDLPEVVSRLLPYSNEQRAELLALIAGRDRLRDRYHALAVLAGHCSPEITLSTYLHFTDLLLGCHLGTNQQPLEDNVASALLGLRPGRIVKMRKAAVVLSPADCAPFLRERLVRYLNIQPTYIAQESSGQWPTRIKPDHYRQSQHALNRIQNGDDLSDVACEFYIDPEVLTRWFNTAIALRELKTSKGRQRLFPKSRCLQLLPPDPVGIEEKNDVGIALKACQLIKKDSADMQELLWAIRYALLHCNSSRAGFRFTSNQEFVRFMRLASRLLGWERWHLLLQTPEGQHIDGWQSSPKMHINRTPLKKSAQFPEGLAWLYLRHAAEQDRIVRGINQYSSHSVRILFHRLAIILFKPETIREWTV